MKPADSQARPGVSAPGQALIEKVLLSAMTRAHSSEALPLRLAER